MADSTHLTRDVEPFVRQWVSQRIGVELVPARLPVGPRADVKVVHFAFDGASEDWSVGLLISSSMTVKPGGTRKLHVDASVLLNAPFERRIIAFVCEDVRQNFENKCDGLLQLSKIETLVCVDLPSEVTAGIAAFQLTAKSEVGDKGGVRNLSYLEIRSPESEA